MRVLCFYLPQFHPIAENNEWWGNGFTEWTNVVKVRPRFRGHRQPQIPADLGFYDLRLNETQIEQAELAQAHGIGGFVYYHYWFSGRRVLETPLHNMLRLGKPDFPFALCWANETWSRNWDGQEKSILLKQTYSIDDHRAHSEYLADIFLDKRYIRVKGRPLLLLYRASDILYFNVFKDLLVEACRIRSLDAPFICGVRNKFSGTTNNEIFRQCDAVVDFQPNTTDFPSGESLFSRMTEVLRKSLPHSMYEFLKTRGRGNKIISYQKLVDLKKKQNYTWHARVFPCVFPSWDNSARRKTALIIQNDDPQHFTNWLLFARDMVKKHEVDEQFIFINAWNEWAEGCHLEPDNCMQHKFLDCVSVCVS